MQDFDNQVQTLLEDQFLVFRHPLHGTLHSAAMIRSADDVARLGILMTPAGVLEKRREWNEILNQKLQDAGIVQNPAKRQWLISWKGHKAREKTGSFWS
jgi:hypothetical protein